MKKKLIHMSLLYQTGNSSAWDKLFPKNVLGFLRGKILLLQNLWMKVFDENNEAVTADFTER